MKALTVVIRLVEIAMYIALAWFVFSTLEVMVHRMFDLGNTYTAINFWSLFVSIFA